MDFYDVDDCIHLKACRRLCKLKKIRNRGCNMNCSAYQNIDDFAQENVGQIYTEQDVYTVIHGMENEYGLSYGNDLISDYI